MRKTKLIVLGLASSLLFSNCIGSFSAFKSIRDWNDGLTQNKFLDNLIFWGLWIVPAYELFLAGDLIIFNVIEFWSGSNPIAMNDGEMETQTIAKNGNTYRLTATKNKLNIEVIDGKDFGKHVLLQYNPEEESWNAIKDGEIIKLSSMEDGFYIVYLPNGEKVKMNPTTSRETGKAILNSAIFGEQAGYVLAH